MKETKIDKPELMTPIFNMDSPKTRTFLRLMNEAKKAPFHTSDFMDDRIPAMKTEEVDQSLLEEKPKGIHTDQEMFGAWRFMQMMLQKAELGALQPLEIVEMYRSVIDCGNKLRELASIKREIKEIKHQMNKKVTQELQEELATAISKRDHLTADMSYCASLPRSKRVALTQAVLIIGFLKEYISLRAVRLENAEEYPVWVPTDPADTAQKVTIGDDQKLYLKPGEYTFYATSIDAYQHNPQTVDRFIPVMKRNFSKEMRIDEDMLDYVKIQITGEESIAIASVDDKSIMTRIDVEALIPKPVPMDMSNNTESTVPEQAVEP